MQQLGAGTIVYGNDVETLAYDWGNIKIVSAPDVTGGTSMTFGLVVLNPGKGHDRHAHGADEVIYVVSGEGEQMVDDQPPVHVRPGAAIYIPKGVVHSTINVGWEPMRLVVVYVPSGAEMELRADPGVQILPPGAWPDGQ
jgi:oxalate decarboxylase/phosphoglucose isomerase-like protein (cupin superfamily)